MSLRAQSSVRGHRRARRSRRRSCGGFGKSSDGPSRAGPRPRPRHRSKTPNGPPATGKEASDPPDTGRIAHARPGAAVACGSGPDAATGNPHTPGAECDPCHRQLWRRGGKNTGASARAGSLKQLRLTPVEGTSGSCHRSCGGVRLRWGHCHRSRCFRDARPGNPAPAVRCHGGDPAPGAAGADPASGPKFRLLIETALRTIIALSGWIGFLYFIYLTD